MQVLEKKYLIDVNENDLKRLIPLQTSIKKIERYKNISNGFLKIIDIDYEKSFVCYDQNKKRIETRIYVKVECQLCVNKTLFSTRIEHFFNKHCKSCGCLSSVENIIENNIKNNDNYKINGWIIKRIRHDLTRKSPINKNGRSHKYVYVECICPKCGKNTIVMYDNIRRKKGFQISCGCSSKIDQAIINNIIGKKFGRLLVEKYLGFYKDENRNKKTVHWFECLCDCGNKHRVEYFKLIRGSCRSCGCLLTETRIKHNISGEPLYSRWRHMNRRCYEQTDDHYKNYGARGIYVCDEWIESRYLSENVKKLYSKKELNEIDRIHFCNFKSFVERYCKKVLNLTVEEAIIDGYTNDRIDVDGPYAPWNCRYVLNIDQSRNKVKSIFVTYKGYRFSIVELLKPFFGIEFDKNEYCKLYDKLKIRNYDINVFFNDYPELHDNLDKWLMKKEKELTKILNDNVKMIGLKLIKLGFSLVRDFLNKDNNHNLYCYKPEWQIGINKRLNPNNIVVDSNGKKYIKCE